MAVTIAAAAIQARYPTGSWLIDETGRLGWVLRASTRARVLYRPLLPDGCWGQALLCYDAPGLRPATAAEQEAGRPALLGVVRLCVGGGHVVSFDCEDLPRIWPLSWSLHRTVRGRYAANGTRRHHLYMHRYLLRPPAAMVVDHINGDGLDNRRCNLRLATNAQNMANSGKRKTPRGTSRFKGVSAAWRKWVVTITVNYKRIRGGAFATEEEAARAYDELARRHFGEFAVTNFG